MFDTKKNELISITLGDLLEKAAREYPNNLALKYTDRDYIRTYSEFDRECDKVAKGLLKI